MVTKEKTGKKKGDTDCTHLRNLSLILPLETYPRESEYPPRSPYAGCVSSPASNFPIGPLSPAEKCETLHVKLLIIPTNS